LRLKVARQLEAEGFPGKARLRYREIVDQYPDTQAAQEAAQALEPKKP
jgi:TolA-binding protein